MNIADFAVAVERLIDSSLRKVPLIIAPSASRAVVYDMSEEAYQEGVRKGMAVSAALKRCRKARLLSPRPEQYHKALERCVAHAGRFSPLVERADGNGHLYIDVTGTHRVFGPPPDIGWRLRKILRKDLGLDPIWSVAPNKLTAKVASRLVKPIGEYIVAAGEESAFLNPLPLHLLPGISSVDHAALRAVNLRKVHQVKALSAQELSVICGSRAQEVYRTVRGVDQVPVSPGTDRKDELCFEHVFTPDTNREQVIRSTLSSLSGRLGYVLRSRGLGCRKITLTLTYTDAIRVVRTAVSRQVNADDRSLEGLALTALYRAWHRRVRIRQIALAGSRRGRLAYQLSLLGDTCKKIQKNNAISKACDVIRERHGAHVVQRGAHSLQARERAGLYG